MTRPDLQWPAKKIALLIKMGRAGETFSALGAAMGCSRTQAHKQWENYAAPEDWDARHTARPLAVHRPIRSANHYGARHSATATDPVSLAPPLGRPIGPDPFAELGRVFADDPLAKRDGGSARPPRPPGSFPSSMLWGSAMSAVLWRKSL